MSWARRGGGSTSEDGAGGGEASVGKRARTERLPGARLAAVADEASAA